MIFNFLICIATHFSLNFSPHSCFNLKIIFYSHITHFLGHATSLQIIIIMLCRPHGYPWPTLATFPYRSSPPAGLLYYIPYLHIAAVCMFALVVLLLLSHKWGSIGVHHLWAQLCSSSSVLHAWFIKPNFKTFQIFTFLYFLFCQFFFVFFHYTFWSEVLRWGIIHCIQTIFLILGDMVIMFQLLYLLAFSMFYSCKRLYQL